MSAELTVAGSQLSPATDPRIDLRLRSALERFGMAELGVPPEVTRDHPHDEIAKVVAQLHTDFEGLYAQVPLELPGDEDLAVTREDLSIEGMNGNTIALHLFRPAASEGLLPGLVYIHGGGQGILNALNRVHVRWCEDLAAAGMVVALVDFRGSHDPAGGHNPFPAGLNDCTSALTWMHENRDQLRIGGLVLQGESGGANLVLATMLRAHREGRASNVDGVYATVPHISGGYAWDDERKRRELPSLLDNDGYFIRCLGTDLLAKWYDPADEHVEDPLAWPYFASLDDLRGLPPHVVSVDELDPLRDEGIAYYRKLVAAGVPTVGRVSLGMTHAAYLIFRQAVPDVRRGTVQDIAEFARSL